MIVRAGTGWQYAIADLSLILFLVTASALAHAGDGKPVAPTPVAQRPSPVAAALDSEPVAVWSPGLEAPALAQWLAHVGDDPRLEVRIVVRYVGGAREAAVAQAVQLAEEGGARSAKARILVEPGENAGASVALVYSQEATLPPSALAR